jgi:hypothetical protein
MINRRVPFACLIFDELKKSGIDFPYRIFFYIFVTFSDKLLRATNSRGSKLDYCPSRLKLIFYVCMVDFGSVTAKFIPTKEEKTWRQ